MNKCLYIILLFCLSNNLWCQSYISTDVGFIYPRPYSANSDPHDFGQSSNLTSTPGIYASFEIKERLDKDVNLGYGFSFFNSKINYQLGNAANKIGYSSLSDVEINSFYLPFQIELEFRLIKDLLYISFGPNINIYLYSYSKSHTTAYSSIGAYNGNPQPQEYYNEGKIGGTTYFLFNTSLYLEKKLDNNLILFSKARIGHPITIIQEDVKVNDIIFSFGIRRFIKGLGVMPDSKPYELN